MRDEQCKIREELHVALVNRPSPRSEDGRGEQGLPPQDHGGFGRGSRNQGGGFVLGFGEGDIGEVQTPKSAFL